MFNKRNRTIVITSIILLLINKNILFGQNSEIELFQGTWFEFPLSQLGIALMSNSYILADGFIFEKDNFKAIRIQGRGLIAMTNPTVLTEGKFTVNTKDKTIVLTDLFGDKATLRYVFSDENNILRLKRNDGFIGTFYK